MVLNCCKRNNILIRTEQNPARRPSRRDHERVDHGGAAHSALRKETSRTCPLKLSIRSPD
jgi:hypothetical protein